MSLWIVSRETSERLAVFEELLLKWNAQINLVGRKESAHIRQRHVEDSLQLMALLPTTGVIVDLGSGGGFPGLIIAVAAERHVILVEADTRKATFLREAARTTGASVEVINARIEQCGVRNAAVITARALAPLERLLDLAKPLLAPEGICFFHKGASVEDELTRARARWQMSVKTHPSLISAGCILEVRHLQTAGANG